MQAADQVEPGLQGFEQQLKPAPRQHAARIGDADHQGARSPRAGLGGGEARQTHAHAAAGQADLAQAPVLRPVLQSEGRLGEGRLGDVAEEQKVGARELEQRRRVLSPELDGDHEYSLRQDAQNSAVTLAPRLLGRIGVTPRAPAASWPKALTLTSPWEPATFLP